MKQRETKFDSKAVSIRRVAKVTAGGKRLRFSAMVVVGDRNGTVGVALGRGVDTRNAIEKATKKAEKNAKTISLVGDTIPHEIIVKVGAAKVMLRPAKPGTGVIAGSSVRTVLELCGIDNVYGKILGSNDLVGNAYCTFEALTQLKNKRVLEKMEYMKKRVNLKEELDKERKKREDAIRKNAKQNDKGKDKKDRRGGGRRNFKPRGSRNEQPVAEQTKTPTPQPDVDQAVKKEVTE